MAEIRKILASGSIRSVFQPIVALASGAVVAYEALARGPVGELERPDLLFAAARSEGVLAELDETCRRAAFRGAVHIGLGSPLSLFVNVEPEVLDTAPLNDLLAIAVGAPGGLRVVMEITERALAARPAELLRTVQRVREFGWGVALDDVGADAMSLAFMPMLRPDVVKLDLRLVQERPGAAVAEIMNGVNAYAERTGAVVLAEGIENADHLELARALGATLGQGWLFGRPSPELNASYPIAELDLPASFSPAGRGESPFACLPASVRLRRSPKPLLIELSKQLEREASRFGDTTVVAATFQDSQHFTAATARRYRHLAAQTAFVCALGEGMPDEPAAGVRGATLPAGDPLLGEWDVVIIGPHFAGALLARDLGEHVDDMDRSFEYALTYDRDTVIRAMNALLARVSPRVIMAEPGAASTTSRPSDPSDSRGIALDPEAGRDVLHRALAATTSGVTITAMDQPDQPLIYVNAAFEELAGLPMDLALGRNCRFMQGPDTDPAVVEQIRIAVATGQECRETVLNYRGPDRSPWWNEILLSPVTDENGAVVQYIGVQNDVTARVTTERALQAERERSAQYARSIEDLAFSDPLTGLANRRKIEEQCDLALLEAHAGSGALAFVYLDLDGFKAVNDRLGHTGGDELLVIVGTRLQASIRHRDLLARLGGDEFLAVLPDLDPTQALTQASRVAQKLTASLAAPVTLGDEQVNVMASVGVSVYPADGTTFRELLHCADMRMYAAKSPGRLGFGQDHQTADLWSPH